MVRWMGELKCEWRPGHAVGKKNKKWKPRRDERKKGQCKKRERKLRRRGATNVLDQPDRVGYTDGILKAEERA
jgi:hypothetical protein